MFHKHEFKKSGLNLWCKCGKTKELKCPHTWKVHYDGSVMTMGVAGNGQRIQTLICECGEIRHINLTLGK